MLNIKHLTKTYGDKRAVDDLTLHIQPGEIYGFIGHNGAGKTTTIKAVCGILQFDSGEIFVDGISVQDDPLACKKRIAYIPDNPDLYEYMSGIKYLNFIADIFSVPAGERQEKIRKYADLFELTDDLAQPISAYSHGMKQKLAIISALIHDPRLIVMDEPFVGLDPKASHILKGLMREICDRGGAIFFSTHVLEVAEKLCDMVAIIKGGRLVVSGSMEAVKGGTRLGTKIINCKDLSFFYGEDCYLDKFTYNFQRYEKVGIVGRNGAGKSTFLNLLTGRTFEDDPGTQTGIIERGESLKIGYYHQSGMDFNPQDTVLDIVNDTWLLNRFLFPHEMLNNKVEKLSGGEKRRLYLLTILMQQPNLLILDEPTNDLDIVTLNILEEYLKEFSGSLIIVSHDRHFLDKLVDHLFIFCGNGVVKDFVGTYSEYREYIKEYEAEQKARERAAEKAQEKTVKEKSEPVKRKLTYKEQKELEQIEKDLEALAAEKAELEAALSSGSLPFDKLQHASERIGQILEETEEKELRWLELTDI